MLPHHTIYFTDDLIQKMEQSIKSGHFTNKSRLVRYAVKNLLNDDDIKRKLDQLKEIRLIMGQPNISDTQRCDEIDEVLADE